MWWTSLNDPEFRVQFQSNHLLSSRSQTRPASSLTGPFPFTVSCSGFRAPANTVCFFSVLIFQYFLFLQSYFHLLCFLLHSSFQSFLPRLLQAWQIWQSVPSSRHITLFFTSMHVAFRAVFHAAGLISRCQCYCFRLHCLLASVTSSRPRCSIGLHQEIDCPLRFFSGSRTKWELKLHNFEPKTGLFSPNSFNLLFCCWTQGCKVERVHLYWHTKAYN